MKHKVHNPGNVHIKSYANLVLLNALYTRIQEQQMRRAQRRFLVKRLASEGDLVCRYCGRIGLKISSPDRKDIATVDHIVPKAKGGKACDEGNFAVCCLSCNEKKGTTLADDFMASRYIERKRSTN